LVLISLIISKKGGKVVISIVIGTILSEITGRGKISEKV